LREHILKETQDRLHYSKSIKIW